MPADPFPACDLIDLLRSKAEQRTDVQFDFMARLNDLRQRVSDEVRQINVLFPEYTPHDEQYHLKRLFPVADTVLGRGLLESLNSAELFVLAAGLYAHDWGMAVSEEEKAAILAGGTPSAATDGTWHLLADEAAKFKVFRANYLLQKDDGKPWEMSIELWREYVRQTHAFRSGQRVRSFFEQTDQGVAEAVARVCEGHWLDIERLQDYATYPPNYAVLRESTNLRALAVYVRLIDMLDLAEDRTPYIIWKFVAPRDPRSQMEWAKHRALHPATSSAYLAGRVLVIDGGTDDHEVYAALEDLRIWVNEQFRACSDVLARMSDPRHQLDVSHIVWRLAARGFTPFSIGFAF